MKTIAIARRLSPNINTLCIKHSKWLYTTWNCTHTHHTEINPNPNNTLRCCTEDIILRVPIHHPNQRLLTCYPTTNTIRQCTSIPYHGTTRIVARTIISMNTNDKEENEQCQTTIQKQQQQQLIRLSKRMSELNLCSRREADTLISQSRVVVNGILVETLGTKVLPTESNIRILKKKEDIMFVNESSNDSLTTSTLFDWDRIRGDTVVLHKPKNYVSGQPDKKHTHEPAVRLLTRNNIYFPSGDNPIDRQISKEVKYTLTNGNHLHFARKKMKRYNRIGKKEDRRMNEEEEQRTKIPSTLMNYAPAGRLDLDSTGVLIFTKNGVIAKHILSPSIEKEYIVDVEPISNITRQERNMGIQSLPYPPRWDVSVLSKKGNRLWNDRKPLKPVVDVQWIEEGKSEKNGGWDGTGKLRIVLREGRKRQIRRMCREFLGLNVKELKRVRVGSVHLGDIPEGRWRTLTEEEVTEILSIK